MTIQKVVPKAYLKMLSAKQDMQIAGIIFQTYSDNAIEL